MQGVSDGWAASRDWVDEAGSISLNFLAKHFGGAQICVTECSRCRAVIPLQPKLKCTSWQAKLYKHTVEISWCAAYMQRILPRLMCCGLGIFRDPADRIVALCCLTTGDRGSLLSLTMSRMRAARQQSMASAGPSSDPIFCRCL